jgi:hypothetical protein
MKRKLVLAAVLSGLLVVSCSKEPKELSAFISYVDSLEERAIAFHQVIDTMYVETSIDPDDPTITITDTVFIKVNEEQNMFYYKFTYAGMDFGLVNKREDVMQRYQSLYGQINQEALSSSQKKSLEEKAGLFNLRYTEYLPDSVK